MLGIYNIDSNSDDKRRQYLRFKHSLVHAEAKSSENIHTECSGSDLLQEFVVSKTESFLK